MAQPLPPQAPQPALQGLAFLIDQALPQTQCTRCGYPDCAHYAQAIAEQGAPINQCAPGGQEGVERLAALTHQAVLPLNRSFGVEGPLTVARIDEAWCIGCTLCIKACPTDAILGANKQMHTVQAVHCTGCELCLPVCPVDCIQLDVVSGDATGWQAWSGNQAEHARARYARHQQRLTAPRRVLRSTAAPQTAPADTDSQADKPLQQPAAPAAVDPKKAAIAAALAKARALRNKA
ncbi:RnfABCDGE type electron transport complex subunit B [Comamonas sp. GB3 AK4-5]|uniref:RnfABCDGE type electron transport complex subunit B n=1 Tax=Comamonas sp. GB3 AK4-5 TaxID=3231487 RepID=UPI00351DB4C2